jgi:hypothetical protein
MANIVGISVSKAIDPYLKNKNLVRGDENTMTPTLFLKEAFLGYKHSYVVSNLLV